MIVERLSYADTLPEYNAPLLATIKRLFGDAELAPVKHGAILGEMAAKAKVIVRTGAFDPWGNILLYSGVDVPAWFSKPGVKAPDYYAKKLQEGLMPRMTISAVATSAPRDRRGPSRAEEHGDAGGSGDGRDGRRGGRR